MNPTTPEQMVQLLQIVANKRLPAEQLQRLLDGGYLADLLEATILPDRLVFQQLLHVGHMPVEIRNLGVYTKRGAEYKKGHILISEGNYSFVAPEIYRGEYVSGYREPTPLALASLTRPVSATEAEHATRALKPAFDFAELYDLLYLVQSPDRPIGIDDFPIIVFGTFLIIGKEQKYPCIRYNDRHQKSLELIERSQCMQMLADQAKFLVLVK